MTNPLTADQLYWRSIWRIVGVCFSLFTVTIASCVAHDRRLLAASADPLAVSCAASANPTVCLAAVNLPAKESTCPAL